MMTVVRAVSVWVALSFTTLGAQAPEGLRGVTERRDMVRTPGGYRVQTIITRPQGATHPLPAVLFVQWLSCDPILLPATGGDGWAAMLRGLIERSGMIVARTEKPGIGASEGPACERLGYQEELAAHRAALESLRRSPDVHPDSVFLFGGSMGGTMVALLGADAPVRGIIVWGSTGIPWLEHLLALDRRVLAMRGVSTAEIERVMPDHERLHTAFLEQRSSPVALTARDSALAAAWSRMLGTSSAGLYGRPFLFHQEAQAAGWSAAWHRVRSPVLVVRGEHDWIMSAAEQQRIVDIVAARPGGQAQLVTVPRLDHNFAIVESDAAALRGETHGFDPSVIDVFIGWLSGQRKRH